MAKYERTKSESRIRAAMSTMPCGGASEDVSAAARRVGFRDGQPFPVSLDDVSAYLEALGEALREVLDKGASTRSELSLLQADLAAFRRILGIGGLP
jgi:hypothetical protein